MLHASAKRIAPILAVLALAAFQAPSARAGFTLTVQEDNGPIIDISGPLNQSPNADTISAVITALNAQLTYFQFNGLSAFSNAPDNSTFATLTQTADVSRTDENRGGNVHTLTIVARDDTFTVPSSNPKFMRTAAGVTFDHTVTVDQRTFQSTFDASGSGGSVISTPSGAFTYVPGAGLGPFQSMNPPLITQLGTQPIPFTLTNTTVITFGANDPNLAGPQHAQTTGATTVQPVPEPGSMALGLISLPALLALGRRMRRRADV
jgi:hypothetical protein